MGTSAYAQIAADSVHYLFRSESPNTSVEKILFLSVGIELAEYGFTSVQDAKNAEYNLVIEYSAAGAGAEVLFSLEESSLPGAVIASVAATVPLDHRINRVLKDAVEKLINQADLNQEAAAKGSISGILPDLVESKSFDEPGLRLTAGLSAGGTVHTGESTDYFLYGAAGGAVLDLIWYAEPWRLTAGADISLSRTFNNSTVSGGTLYIGTTGLHLALGNSDFVPLPWNIIIGGGAAQLAVSSGSDTLIKSVPYVEAGVKGAVFQFSKYYLNAKLIYRTIFDPDILVSGIVPTIELVRRF